MNVTKPEVSEGSSPTCKDSAIPDKMFNTLIFGREARLVDDGLNDVDEGQDGELIVRGPTVFRYDLLHEVRGQVVNYTVDT